MRALLFCLTVFLSACAASPYTQSGITGGFDDQQISSDTFAIGYYGNAYTSEETVQTHWLHHAAEVALAHGYDGFGILGNVRLTQAEPGAGSARMVPAVESGGVTGKPYMVERIRLLRAPLPEGTGSVFDARALKAFLDPYVLGEKCGTNVCPHVHRYLLPGFGQTTAPPV